jgi:hypothetical protein
VTVESGDCDRRRIVGGDHEIEAYAIGIQPCPQEHTSRVVGQTAQESHLAAESGDRPRRVVRAPAGYLDHVTVGRFDPIDQRLAGDDD